MIVTDLGLDQREDYGIKIGSSNLNPLCSTVLWYGSVSGGPTESLKPWTPTNEDGGINTLQMVHIVVIAELSGAWDLNKSTYDMPSQLDLKWIQHVPDLVFLGYQEYVPRIKRCREKSYIQIWSYFLQYLLVENDSMFSMEIRIRIRVG